MARVTPDIIVIDDNIAIKKDEHNYIICYAYKNGKKDNAEIQWVNKFYYGSLGKALKALPDAMLGNESINSLDEAYQKCIEIAEKLSMMFVDKGINSKNKIEMKIEKVK